MRVSAIASHGATMNTETLLVTHHCATCDVLSRKKQRTPDNISGKGYLEKVSFIDI